MAYSEYLAERVERVLGDRHVDFEMKKMMGGLCVMVDGKMCLGFVSESLMCRVGPDVYEDCLKKSGCVEMDFTGRPMKGFVFVGAEALESYEELDYWVGLCLEYNPLAKRSRKRGRT